MPVKSCGCTLYNNMFNQFYRWRSQLLPTYENTGGFHIFFSHDLYSCPSVQVSQKDGEGWYCWVWGAGQVSRQGSGGKGGLGAGVGLEQEPCSWPSCPPCPWWPWSMWQGWPRPHRWGCPSWCHERVWSKVSWGAKISLQFLFANKISRLLTSWLVHQPLLQSRTLKRCWGYSEISTDVANVGLHINIILNTNLNPRSAATKHALYVPTGALWGGEDIRRMAERGILIRRGCFCRTPAEGPT